MTALILTAILISVGTGAYDMVLESNDALEVFPESHIILIGCEIAHNADSPGMDDFSEVAEVATIMAAAEKKNAA